MPAAGLDRHTRPEPYKQYPQKPKIDLPAFDQAHPMSLDQTLRQRRSVREFKHKPISLGQLSYLLWASAGIQRTEHGCQFRTAPSAGALYPIETYIVANNVQDLHSGLYHYAVSTHQLEQLSRGDFHRQIAAAALGQDMCATAGVVFVWSAVFERCKWKYGQRAYRYIYLDAGHIAENLALAAVSLGLGSCEVGALYDDLVNKIFDLDGTQESIICMAAAGPPA
jgi:SagB-type dehydrogenase family enzyme